MNDDFLGSNREISRTASMLANCDTMHLGYLIRCDKILQNMTPEESSCPSQDDCLSSDKSIFAIIFKDDGVFEFRNRSLFLLVDGQ